LGDNRYLGFFLSHGLAWHVERLASTRPDDGRVTLPLVDALRDLKRDEVAEAILAICQAQLGADFIEYPSHQTNCFRIEPAVLEHPIRHGTR
jgi:hypothetical protein